MIACGGVMVVCVVKCWFCMWWSNGCVCDGVMVVRVVE